MVPKEKPVADPPAESSSDAAGSATNSAEPEQERIESAPDLEKLESEQPIVSTPMTKFWYHKESGQVFFRIKYGDGSWGPMRRTAGAPALLVQDLSEAGTIIDI